LGEKLNNPQAADAVSWTKVKNGLIANADCRDAMKTLEADSVDLVIADPPYNYEFVGREWDHEEIQRRLTRVKEKSNSTIIKNVPYGSGLAGGKRDAKWYQRNQQNAIDYEAWTKSWADELFRVCKPGAYVAIFNATRFLARVQIAFEDAGFYPRDVIVMEKQGGLPRGLNAVGKLTKEGDPNAELWTGYHSALRNAWEGVVLLQKPLTDNYLTTLKDYGTGLMKAVNEDGTFKTNIFNKITKREVWPEGAQELHATPKPMAWIDWLVELLCPPRPDAVVLDPFFGTGTTGIAAENFGVKWIGIDLVPDYVVFAKQRIMSNGSN
jgi:site-specific DNA-methyltransferase (adenine-specific)